MVGRDQATATSTPLESALNQLDGRITDVTEQVQKLARRLESVLLPVLTVTESAGPGTPQKPNSPVVDLVHLNVRRLEDIAAVLRGLQERVQV